MQQLDRRKTVDDNKIVSPEEAAEIVDRMAADKRGNRDAGFDLFYLQAITGTRIQEVAGLRHCDFVERERDGKKYLCIQIKAWKGRGHARLGQGGIKNTQSERLIPLPDAAASLWKKYAAKAKEEDPAFPAERPKTARAHWGDNLARRMRDKLPFFQGTHCWRETLINNCQRAGVDLRAVEMVTGKTGSSALRQYWSDDLFSMKRAVEANFEQLRLPAYDSLTVE